MNGDGLWRALARSFRYPSGCCGRAPGLADFPGRSPYAPTTPTTRCGKCHAACGTIGQPRPKHVGFMAYRSPIWRPALRHADGRVFCPSGGGGRTECSKVGTEFEAGAGFHINEGVPLATIDAHGTLVAGGIAGPHLRLDQQGSMGAPHQWTALL